MARQRGNSWQADLLLPNGKRHRRQFPTEHQALAWESRAKERLSKGLSLEDAVVPLESWTLRRVADAVELRFWKGTPNERNAIRNADAVLDILGENTEVNSVTSLQIDNLIHRLRQDGNSGATINRKLAALSKILRYAQNRGLIDKVPSMERSKERSGRIRFYSLDEEARILDWCSRNNPPLGTLVMFLADTGCRLGEAIRLQGKDLTKTHVTFWEVKNGKPRTVPLTKRLQVALQMAVDAPGCVLPGWSSQRASEAWKAVRASNGICDKEAVLHAWRHTCATRLITAGVPIYTVSKWLGHKSLAMTMRYAHFAPVILDSARATLDTVVTQNVSCDNGADLVRTE